MTRLRTEWITDVQRFREIGEAWDRLATLDGGPFSLHRWYDAWWEAFGAGAEMSSIALWDGDDLAAALPLRTDGRELLLLANSHTPVASPLHRDGEALDALTREVAAADGHLVLPRLAVADPATAKLVESGRRAGRLALVEPDQISPFVQITGTWEGYRERMKRRWSSSERKARKMAREHDATFIIVEPPSDLDRQLTRGFEVEASGWKGRAGTAILSTPETERFYRTIARAYRAAGELAISEIALDGHCVAFDLCLLHRQRLYLLKTGFDESYAPLSPGLVLRQQVVRRCFELGLETHELLGDDTEWKRRFSTGVRHHTAVQLLRRTPVGISRYGYRRFARPLMRSAYRSAKARLGR